MEDYEKEKEQEEKSLIFMILLFAALGTASLILTIFVGNQFGLSVLTEITGSIVVVCYFIAAVFTGILSFG